MTKYYNISFNDIEHIIDDCDYEKVLENPEEAKKIIELEIKNLESQGLKVYHHDLNNDFIVLDNESPSFKYWDTCIITQSDVKGNKINTFKDSTRKDITNTKIKIITKYLKELNSYSYKIYADKNYITFCCPLCNKTDEKMCISINSFNIRTFSQNDCTDEKHKKAWKKWKKDIKELWNTSREKEKLVFNLGISYVKKVVKESFPKIVNHDKQLYRYDEKLKHYVELIETPEYSDLDKLIYENFVGENETFISSRDKNDVKNAIKNGIKFPEMKKESDYLINFLNGVYDVNTGELMTHSSDYFFTYILPCNYNKNNKNGKLSKIVLDWGVKLDDIKKVLGYSFQSSCHLEKSFYIIGKPNCGKGTFLSFVKHMFGAKAESITVEDLYGTHGTTNIINKTCLIDEDFDNKTFLNNSVKLFNKITSGEWFNLNRKFRDTKTIQSSHKFILAANDLPRFRSEHDNGGFRRRIFYLFFTNQYKLGKNQNSNIKQEFKKSDEMMSEFMNWVIDGMLMLKNHDNTLPFFDHQDKENEEIMRKAEPVIDYLYECIEKTENVNDRIKSTEVYQNYKTWCSENHIDNPVGVQTFYKKLVEYGVDEKHINKPMKIHGKTCKGIKGIKLTNTISKGNTGNLKVIKGEV